jgi:hypothetical protein
MVGKRKINALPEIKAWSYNHRQLYWLRYSWSWTILLRKVQCDGRKPRLHTIYYTSWQLLEGLRKTTKTLNRWYLRWDSNWIHDTLWVTQVTVLACSFTWHLLTMKMRAFWDIATCSLGVDRCFRGAYCLHHWEKWISNTLMIEAVLTSETLVYPETTRCNIPKGFHLHTRRRENLKSHIYRPRVTAYTRSKLLWVKVVHC